MRSSRQFPIRLLSLLIAGSLWPINLAAAKNDPCEDYRSKLAYIRSENTDEVDLTLRDERYDAYLTIRVPRTFVTKKGNLEAGDQCAVGLEVFWPQMAPAGRTDFSARMVRDRTVGDMPAWRSLTIAIEIDRKLQSKWFPAARYCGDRLKLKELSVRPFGLRALNDGSKWPRHVQSDGAYRSMNEFASFPLNEANLFYFVDGPVDEMVRIACTNGAPRCKMETTFGGFDAAIFFNSDDLSNWSEYRSRVGEFIARHSVDSGGTMKNFQKAIDMFRPETPQAACMREIDTIAEPERRQLR